MTAADVSAAVGGATVAVCSWAFMFRLDRRDIWPRTWFAAVFLAAYGVGATVLLGNVRTLVGPVSLGEIGIGTFIGIVWVFATQLGAALLSYVAPSFINQISGLYRLAVGSSAARVVGPLVAMAFAEELLFRGLIQARVGLAAAVVIYSAVQIVEGKWPLIVAAVLGAIVWGSVFVWRDGLVASSIAHAIWTVSLTLVWPIGSATSRVEGAAQRP